MATGVRRVLLVQLPIPPAGPQPIRGNVPLAGAYLKLYAESTGAAEGYQIDLLPTADANTLSDQGLAKEILAREPWLVGFTCYLWNIDRTLHVATLLKAARPDLKIMVGGPEITADNDWTIHHPAIDYAGLGEGEQTFAEFLRSMQGAAFPPAGLPGLHVRGRTLTTPPFRTPLADLDPISSPYLAGILDAADEKMMLLETIRGCVFKCKFCYYPKSYEGLHFLSEEKVVANLRHATERGATEVVMLDPTLNQRKRFNDFVKLLAKCNPDGQFTYFGELRGEGVGAETALLLKAANFAEIEVGLQSLDPEAQRLMSRRNSMAAFEKGATAMMDAGLRVKVDLIVGLPGDTPESIRAGFHYLKRTGLYHHVQVFQLSILPGTEFRKEVALHGLKHQPRPPYYVLGTPTLDLPTMMELMAEAQDIFDCEFDAPPEPQLRFPPRLPSGAVPCWIGNLDGDPASLPAPAERSQAFAAWFHAADFARHGQRVCATVRGLLDDNPHTSLQVVLEPSAGRGGITLALLDAILEACQHRQSYLDKFYALLPGRGHGAKRVVAILPWAERARIDEDFLDELGARATLVWRDAPAGATEAFADFEHELR